MEIARAQKDVRQVFLGGFAGQLVSGIVWAVSAALATWSSQPAAVAALFFGGMFIFPMTQLLLHAMGHANALPKGHPMNALAMQVAFTLPLSFPVVFAAFLPHPAWFFPAFMVAVGAHYLPFVFLYGMWQFAVLSGVLITAGTGIGVYLPQPFSLGGWFTAAMLLVFAFWGRAVAIREEETEESGNSL